MAALVRQSPIPAGHARMAPQTGRTVDSTLQKPPTALAGLAIVAALATMALKFGAYLVTGSVGLLSDAVESSANQDSSTSRLSQVSETPTRR